MIPGNAVIAQGGGPTAVINQSLVGAILELKRSPQIKNIYGAIHGVVGIVNEDFIDLTLCSENNLEKVANSPASALFSTRDKPDNEYCDRIFDVLKAHDIRYFYYIGGNDSADTCRIISETAESVGYELNVVHIPKTIDNDLRVTDHTPGFGSAAKVVASAFAGVNLDNRSLPGVYIGVVMGRHAGFLTASSALAKRYEDDAPHRIYIPEVPFSEEIFLKHVQETYSKLGRCVVAVSEGLRYEDGTPVVAKLQKTDTDAHGNMQLSGTGALADYLVQVVKKNLDVNKVRGDTYGYIQRSLVGCVSDVDAQEARTVGEMAVKFSLRDNFVSGSLVLNRSDMYTISYGTVALQEVARETKCMADEYYDPETATVTTPFFDYVRPIVGDLEHIELLEKHFVPKILRK